MVWDRDKCFEVLTNRYFERSRGTKLRLLFEKHAVDLCESVFQPIGAPYWFTNHGVEHSDHVLYFALRVASVTDECLGRLNEVEAMALACACYLHDLAMARIPEQFDLSKGWSDTLIREVRMWHVKSIEELLPKYREELLPLYKWKPLLEDVLPIVCKAHGTETHRLVCEGFSKDYKHYGGFRGELLGKILLLADELDLAEHRSMVGRHPQFEKFPCMAKAHQFKHHYIIDVDVQLPIVRIIFVFPEEMPLYDRIAFKEWTCQKLRCQIEMVQGGLVSQYQRAFEIIVQPEEGSLRIRREPCDKEICKIVKDCVEEGTEVGTMASEIIRYRPNHFHPKRLKPQEAGPLYPMLNRLMDDFFRGCDTAAAAKHFSEIYIDIPGNDKVGKELIKSLKVYSKAVREHRDRGRLPSQEIFAITGSTGAGKSTVVMHLENSGRLRTRFFRGGSGLIVVHINCLNLRTFVDVIRTMLDGLVNECRDKPKIWAALRSKGWTIHLKPTAIAMLPERDALSTLRGVLDVLHKRGYKKISRIVPVCFVLDNVDRMPGFEVKRETVVFAVKECKSRGYPFFVVTLRYGTKKMIDDHIDDIPAIAKHGVVAPDIEDILRARLDVAFSEHVAGKTGSWCEPAPVQTLLGRINLSFKDLRKSLMVAMETLVQKKNETGVSFIPSMAASNMRSALTLFRAIVKAIDKKELLMLSHGLLREHHLIKCAMLEFNPCYFESVSKIRNIFRPSIDGFYFGKLYLLRILALLQRRLPDKGYVDLGNWKNVVEKSGIKVGNFMIEVWNLLCGELALLDVEGTDDTVPNDMFRNMEDLEYDIGIRMSPAGEYYLSWLMYDIAYLQCVLQDTVMDAKLAEDLGKEQTSAEETVRQVEKYISFLETKETEERISWGLPREMRRFKSELRRRFELQKRAMISEEKKRDSVVSGKIPIVSVGEGFDSGMRVSELDRKHQEGEKKA